VHSHKHTHINSSISLGFAVCVFLRVFKWDIFVVGLCLGFYRAASLQGGFSHNQSVRLSVCLSVKTVNRDNTNETSVHIIIPYERSI